MPNEWHYTLGGQQMATPVPATELRRLAASGQLLPTDMLWREGMPSWVTAGSVKDLFPDTVAPPEPGAGLIPPSRPERLKTPTKPAKGLPDLHPLVVLLVSLLTLGLFGLYYVFRSCLEFSALEGRQRADASGRPLGRLRHPLWVLLLGYMTVGIYLLYWVYRVLAECSAYAARGDIHARNELSLMLLFPPYAIYLIICRLPGLIRSTQSLAGVPETVAPAPSYLFLLPFMLPALPFLALTYQDALNQVWLAAIFEESQKA